MASEKELTPEEKLLALIQQEKPRPAADPNPEIPAPSSKVVPPTDADPVRTTPVAAPSASPGVNRVADAAPPPAPQPKPAGEPVPPLAKAPAPVRPAPPEERVAKAAPAAASSAEKLTAAAPEPAPLPKPSAGVPVAAPARAAQPPPPTESKLKLAATSKPSAEPAMAKADRRPQPNGGSRSGSPEQRRGVAPATGASGHGADGAAPSTRGDASASQAAGPAPSIAGPPDAAVPAGERPVVESPAPAGTGAAEPRMRSIRPSGVVKFGWPAVNRILALVALVLVVVVVYSVASIRSDIDKAVASQVEEAGTLPVAPVGGDAVKPPALDEVLKKVAGRDVFLPLGGGAGGGTNVTDGARTQDFKLLGVSLDAKNPAQSMAIVRHKTSGRTYFVKAGDAVGDTGFTLSHVLADRAVAKKQKQEIEIR